VLNINTLRTNDKEDEDIKSADTICTIQNIECNKRLYSISINHAIPGQISYDDVLDDFASRRVRKVRL